MRAGRWQAGPPLRSPQGRADQSSLGGFRVRVVPVRLRCRAVAASGVTMVLGGLLMRGRVPNMGGYCAFVDLGGFLV
jgi:hypothetical protein